MRIESPFLPMWKKAEKTFCSSSLFKCFNNKKMSCLLDQEPISFVFIYFLFICRSIDFFDFFSGQFLWNLENEQIKCEAKNENFNDKCFVSEIPVYFVKMFNSINYKRKNQYYNFIISFVFD